MKAGISGLLYSGKTTIFNALKAKSSQEEETQSAKKKSQELFTAKVKDPHLNELDNLFPGRKIVYPELVFVDIPTRQKDNVEKPDFLLLRDQDVIIEVVRFFEREDVLHTEGSIDPKRDIALFEEILINEDLAAVNERITRVETELKKGRKENQKEFDVLTKCRAILENKKPLRTLRLSLDEEKLIRGFKYLSLKPIVRVVNSGEEKKQPDIEKLKNELSKCIPFYGRLELEMEELTDEALKADFLKDLGVTLCGAEIFIKQIYDNTGLITFFTVGDEITRGWAIIKGTKAPQAGGKIHTDIERGFIKAEIIEYGKFIESRSFNAAKQKGYLRQEDKDYVIQDGDIVNIKFSV